MHYLDVLSLQRTPRGTSKEESERFSFFYVNHTMMDFWSQFMSFPHLPHVLEYFLHWYEKLQMVFIFTCDQVKVSEELRRFG